MKSNLIWPLGIVGALTIVGIANAWMVWNAVSHPSVPAAQDHWAESLAYEEVIAQKRKSAELGWRAEVEACGSDEGGRCRLLIRLVDPQGVAVEGLTGRARLQRGDTTRADVELELEHRERGQYVATWSPSLFGEYGLVLEFEGEPGKWRHERRVSVRAPGEGTGS